MGLLQESDLEGKWISKDHEIRYQGVNETFAIFEFVSGEYQINLTRNA